MIKALPNMIQKAQNKKSKWGLQNFLDQLNNSNTLQFKDLFWFLFVRK